MKKLIPFTAAFALAAAGTAFAGGDHAKKFESLDANSNGAIERSELQAHPEAMEQFSAADANANGKLEAAEFAQIELTGSDDDSATSTSRTTDTDTDTDLDADAN
jgi:Ca2+-binding EF-hand superfamily protein